MKYLFIEYPKCSTCQKAKHFLKEHHIQFDERHIVINHPTKEELKIWYERSGLPLKRFFNTSGLVYKELGLKDKLVTMGEEEQLELLASNGMLVKRPLLISEDFILIGFRMEEWEKKIKF